MSPDFQLKVISEDCNTACVRVDPPKRLIRHPSGKKFELQKITFNLKAEDGGMFFLTECGASFNNTNSDPDPLQQVCLSFPPQVKPMSGNLIVAAVYGDGRVESREVLVKKLPVYGNCMFAILYSYYTLMFLLQKNQSSLIVS